MRAANELASAIRVEHPQGEKPNFEILGPAPAPLARLRGRYRYQILVKSRDWPTLHRAGRLLAAHARRLPREIQTALDLTPVHML